MSKRVALVFLTLASPMVLGCFFIEHRASFWIFTLVSMTFPIALIALGGQRQGHLGPLRAPLAALWLLLLGSATAMLVLSGSGRQVGFLGGLPPATAVMLGLLWLAPLVLVGWAYAATFESFTLTEKDLERYEELRREQCQDP
ncbi:MAG: hypothetical protein K0U98_27820 [Deltaproteobacteria bacterium]|nr:hypothetical protein [Deltaproteobacteria bacterium]